MKEERSIEERLADARNFAAKAHDLVGGMPLSMLRRIDYYQHALRSYLIIVGEALGCVPPEFTKSSPEIPWRMITGMRNRLVHAYWRVDLDIVHRAARDHAPDLIARLDKLIARTE